MSTTSVEDSALADFGKTVGVVRDDVLGLKRDYTGVVQTLNGVSASIERLSNRFDALSARYEESRRPQWSLVVAAGGILASAIAGFWLILNLQINAQITPLNLSSTQVAQTQRTHDQQIVDLTRGANDIARQLSTMSQTIAANAEQLRPLLAQAAQQERDIAASSQADANSRVDRAQLNDRVRTIEQGMAAGLAERRSQVSEISSRLLEIETQFKGQSNIFNVTVAQLHQWLALLYEQVNPGRRFPENDFRPQMYQDSPQPIGNGR